MLKESEHNTSSVRFTAAVIGLDGEDQVLDLREIDYPGQSVFDATILTSDGTIEKRCYTSVNCPKRLSDPFLIEAESEVVERRGPYTIVNRHKLHDRFGMTSYHDVVVMPNERLGHYYWSDFTNTEINQETRVADISQQAVLLFALINNPKQPHDPNLVLTNEFCYATNELLLEVPGGTKEKQETAAAAALREAAEEVGLTTSEIGSLLELTESASITSRIHNPTKRFLVVLPESTPLIDATPDETEAIHRLVLPWSQVLDLLTHPNPKRPIVTDSVKSGIWEINHFFSQLYLLARLDLLE